MTPGEMLRFLQDFHAETLELFQTRVATARAVAGYDANNGYQQVLGRQDVHLQWLADAIAGLGGAAPVEPRREATTTPARADGRALVEADAHAQRAFIERWTPRVREVTNARDRKMLALVLGEMAEHLRVLQFALDGRSDLLGRHADGKVLRGSVLPVRPGN